MPDTPSAPTTSNERWTELRSSQIDATGDLFTDCIEDYRLTTSTSIPPVDETERATLIYHNDDQSIKLVATPYWHPAIGESYQITIFQRAA